jgi:hypothetical protein
MRTELRLSKLFWNAPLFTDEYISCNPRQIPHGWNELQGVYWALWFAAFTRLWLLHPYRPRTVVYLSNIWEATFVSDIPQSQSLSLRDEASIGSLLPFEPLGAMTVG